MWGWIYRDGFITSAYPKEGFDRLAPALDPIVFATKGKVLLRLEREGDWAWIPKGERVDRNTYSGRSGNHGIHHGKGRWPRTVVASEGIEGFQYFILSRTNGGQSENHGHPSQKPLALFRWLVAKLPPSDRPILDPYAGSGTTLVAAQEEGFTAIGIEVNPAYHATARRRIDAERSKTPLLEGMV